jgi:hypothetical protein
VNGTVTVSRDGGQSWQPAADGLDVPWPEHMVERFVAAGDELLAIRNRGDVYSSRIGAWQWRPVLPEAGHVTAAWLMVE